MSITSPPALLQQICNLYFFGQTDSAQIEKETNLSEFYNQEEIDELELNTKQIEKQSKNIFLHLNTDWDSFPGSVRNSAASLFDAFFSSIGSRITDKLNSQSKFGITAGTFLTAIAANRFKIPLLSNKISIFNYAGRLLRAPFHIFDSSFSAIGESWSQSSIANLFALGSGVLGLTNSISQAEHGIPQINDDLDYQSINGTLARSSLHNLQSLTSSFAQNIYKFNPILGALSTLGLTGVATKLPEKIKEHNISWQNLSGVLSQNLFHFADSLYAGLGSLITKVLTKSKIASVLFLPTLIGASFSKELKDLMASKLIYTKFQGKTMRSALHALDTIVFNLGTEFSKTKLALPFIGAYGALSYSSSLSKNKLLPKIPDFKVPLNELGSLIHRLGFDFVESLISASSNKLGQKIPAPLLFLLGPAISHKLGILFKDAKTPFNSSRGLLLKHSIHFWDNLLTSSGYKTGNLVSNLVLGKNQKEHSGSILSDGRWLTNTGRIVSKMALAKQLAA